MRSGGIRSQPEAVPFRMFEIGIDENRLCDKGVDVLAVMSLPFFELLDSQRIICFHDMKQQSIRIILPPEVVVAVHGVPPVRMVEQEPFQGIAEYIVLDDDIAGCRQDVVAQKVT